MWPCIALHSAYNCAGAIFREKSSRCLGKKRKRRVRDFRAINSVIIKSKYRLNGNDVDGMIISAKEVNSKTRFTHTTSYCAGFFGEKVCVKRVFLWAIINMKPKKLVYGVGINDADHVVRKNETIGYVNGKRKQKKVWECPYYQAWRAMIGRCYSDKLQERKPTYAGCNVSEDWHTFGSFKTWMEKQDWEGKQLDKDILVKDNKIYSAETCVFVTQMVNMFTIDSGAARGEWLIGACWIKPAKKFMSSCRNPFTGKKEHLGLFDSEQEAHEAWLKRKLKLAHLLAAEQEDPRVATALVDRYSQYCV